MKQIAVNEFKDGMNLDLHPLVTPNTVLTDNLNGTFITYNGNEFCLQNDRGNKYITSLTPGYTPIGIKEHNGILYIVSINGNKTEIGTFPSLGEIAVDGTTVLTDSNFYNLELTIVNQYKALKIGEDHDQFTNVELGYDIEHPVTIEIQDSYDGSVNLILVANGVPTKIINSGFSKLSDTTGKWIKRSQTVDTNVYHLNDANKLNQEINLIRTSTEITNIDLLGVQAGGQFKGGNYTFYIKFGDADYNQTDVVAESGIVSIFNGNDGVPSTISGTLLDERTDKMINLRILGLNPVYSKIYIYYSREYSDVQGYRMTEYGMFSEPIGMDYDENRTDLTWDNTTYQDIWLTGFEQTVPIDSEILNIDYHTIDWARAEAQHSNMLFLGNVGQEKTFQLYQNLKEYTKSFIVEIKQDLLNEDITKVSNDYKSGEEYYSTANIYSKLGYWPDEIYRFGIVYILKDGSTTPVFNVTGGTFSSINSTIDTNQYVNEYGVFRTPKADIITNTNSIHPLYFNFSLPNDISLLEENNIVGWFVVRQKRIPRTICQGLSIGIDEKSNLPMVWNGDNWTIESFLSLDRSDKDRQQALLNEIKKLEGAYKNTWWQILLGLSLLPTIGVLISPGMLSVAITYGATKTIYSKAKLEALKNNIMTSKKPMLYYYADSLKEFDLNYYGIQQQHIEGQTYAAVYTDYSTWYDAYEQQPKVLANEAILIDNVENVDDDKPVYEYRYTLLEPFGNSDIPIGNSPLEHNMCIFVISNEPDYLTDVIIERNGENRRIMLFTEPEEVNAVLSNELGWLTLTSDMRKAMEAENALIRSFAKYQDRYIYESTANLKGRGLLSLDPCINNSVGSMLDGSMFQVIDEYNVDCSFGAKNEGQEEEDLYYNDNYLKIDHENYVYVNPSSTSKELKCVYIAPNTNIKVVDNYEFSNIAGTATEVNQFKHTTLSYYKDIHYKIPIYSIRSDNDNYDLNIIRGKFTPYIGIASNELNASKIYSVRLNEKTTNLTNLFLVRQQDLSEYYCVSRRNLITQNINVYRGDCYTNTVTMRILNNFLDPTAPIADQILKPEGWYNMLLELKDKESGENNSEEQIDPWSEVNLSDINTVDLGYWVTFKCLSSYNLGLRSIDTFHTDEMSLLGSPRSFYPLNGASTATGNKMEESFLLNDGLSATVGRKRYNLMPDVPYSKSEFSNRIMFSNVNVTDAFTNGYRTFQGLSYKDYDKQYGAITKLISLGQNIFVVMEHGLGLVPVNPKALMQTTTGEAIHIYGYGVLPDEMTIISQDYGSKYEHSVIRTPIGIYGIDVDAKKVWRFSDKQGFETISDMKIETYLKDYLKPLQTKMGIKDIRTHYNAKKGDLMFTWDDKETNSLYSICFNERQNIWTTKYNWKPVVSDNINDSFYSLNSEAIWHHAEDVGFNGEHVSQWYGEPKTFEFEFVVSEPLGINKIFDNLQIISNNVQPGEMEITIVGDDYVFKRMAIDLTIGHKERDEYENVTKIHTTSDIHGDKESTQTETEHSPKGYYHFDKRLNQSVLTKWQPFKDIYKFGRRIGNIQYKEGRWFGQIEPILINDNKEARIRDKWAKIRIRYSGKDLAVITAIKTLINL